MMTSVWTPTLNKDTPHSAETKLESDSNTMWVGWATPLSQHDRWLVSGSAQSGQDEPVDEIISQLVVNENFNSYIEETNAKIIEDVSKFKNIADKYD